MIKIRCVCTLLLFLLVALILGGSAYVDAENRASADEVERDVVGGIMARRLEIASPGDIAKAQALGMEFVGKITDVHIIDELVALGYISTNAGRKPHKIVRFFAANTYADDATRTSFDANVGSAICVSVMHNYYGIYLDDYENYVLPSSLQIKTTFSISYANGWMHEMNDNMIVDGSVYSIYDVQCALQNAVGYEIGRKKLQTLYLDHTTIFDETLKLFASYRVLDWSAKVGAVEIARGLVWQPNGFVLQIASY